MSQTLKIKKINKADNYAKYEIGAFSRGYGHTFATPLRRILLSSIPGTSITKVRIDGVSQEFSTIPGIKQDVMQIILNLQKVVFIMTDSKSEKVKLSAKGIKTLTAAELVLPGNVTIANPEQLLADLTDSKAKIDLELELEFGYGFELRNDELRNQEIGTIPLNKNFSPIEKVNVSVENTRVGQETDFENIILEITTNGGITPDEALKLSSNTFLTKLNELNAVISEFEDTEVNVSSDEETK